MLHEQRAEFAHAEQTKGRQRLCHHSAWGTSPGILSASQQLDELLFTPLFPILPIVVYLFSVWTSNLQIEDRHPLQAQVFLG